MRIVRIVPMMRRHCPAFAAGVKDDAGRGG